MDEAHRDLTDDRPPDGASFQGVARPSRATPALIALAALAVLAFALLTKQPDPAAGVPTAGVPALPQRSEGTPSSPGPFVTRPSSSTLAPPTRNQAVTPRPGPIATLVEAGMIELGSAGQGAPRVHVVLGDGWMRASDGTLEKAIGAAQSRITVGAWRLKRVHVFPCRWSAGVFADPRLVQTAEGQAQALASWWGQDPGMPPDSNAPIAPIATRPRPSTLAGYPAWFLQILVPSDFDLAACDGGQVVLWESTTGGARLGAGPGELIRLWVVDIDGQPIVVEGSTLLTGPAEVNTELDAIVDSLIITPGVG